LFCHVCDVYRPDPRAGMKANGAARLLAHFLDGVALLAIFMTIALVSCGIGAAGIRAGNSVNSQDLAGIGSLAGFGTFCLAIAGYIVFLLFFLGTRKNTGKSNCGYSRGGQAKAAVYPASRECSCARLWENS
jgi:hypothetical protein